MAATKSFFFGWLTAALWALGGVASAAVLPEERIDILYHSYEGGGVKIDGPSVLVRKNFGNAVSVSGKYYVDTVSGAPRCRDWPRSRRPRRRPAHRWKRR